MTDDELPIADAQKILIVEDDIAVFADRLTSLLSIHGFDVIKPTDRKSLMNTRKFCLKVKLLFTDVVMPKCQV